MYEATSCRTKWPVHCFGPPCTCIFMHSADFPTEQYVCVFWVKVSYCIGLVLNEAVNWILKHSIKELRPLRSM